MSIAILSLQLIQDLLKYQLGKYVFDIANVTVILGITRDEAALYSVLIDPLISLMLTRRNEYQFTVPYNTDFNVSVEATVCGQISATYTFMINYGECIIATA